MSGEQTSGASAGRAVDAAVSEESIIDEVPAEVRAAARHAFASRDRGAAVLDLVSDSLLDDGLVPSAPRRLVFGSTGGPRVQVEVHPVPGGNAVRLDVHTDEEGLQVLEVRSGGQPAAVARGAAGQTTAGPVQHGLLTVVLGIGEQRFQSAALRV